VALMVLLVACGSQPVPEGTVHDTPHDTTHWRLLGKLGVRSPTYNGSVSMDWHNVEQGFHISLTGMLGVKLARISSDHGVIELAVPDKPSQILNAGELQTYLGYELPIVHIPHWVQGHPNPDATSMSQDSGFEQAGWRVEYLKYQASLPRKMRFSYGETRLTLLIRKWDF
jgi:outer membrane lipoprotein LolB